MNDSQRGDRSEVLATNSARYDREPAGHATPLVAAYRQFLMEPRVESEFLALKAVAQRGRSTARERQSLVAAAAAAEVDAGRLARASDEDQRRVFDFRTGTTLALLLAIVDAVPAFLAAQAFGADQPTTIGITAVLVAALAAAMWAINHYHAGLRRLVIVTALGAGLTAIGALRWWYLFVTAGDETAAVLEAIGLTIFTTLLVWLGVVVLSFTKERHVSRAERYARALRRREEMTAAREAALNKRAEVEMRELMGRAQVFSSRHLDDDGLRDRFLEHVRSEVEK
jgi:hypothetical protein